MKTRGEDKTITNQHLLFFIGATTRRKKKHEDDNYMLSFSCLRRVGIKGEDNNDFCDHGHLFFSKA